MVFVGVDIGKNGGLGVINSDAEVLLLEAMPKNEAGLIALISSICDEHRQAKMWLEVPFASKPSKGFVKFCEHAGYVRGLFEALGVETERVQASLWMRHMHLSNEGTTKERSIETARYLYPDQCFRKSAHHAAKEFHDGMVEALLIARYGLETSLNACA